MSTRREKLRQETHQEILDTARQQIAEEGAAALSLRAIAREMGMTAPAIYRYFENRDALVTALILEAYASFGIALETHTPQGTANEDFIALGMAYRAWARKHPEQYQLIFGTPIPGYQAPEEETIPAARKTLLVLVAAIEALRETGNLNPQPEYAQLPESIAAAMEQFGEIASSIYLATLLWSKLHGLVSLELNNHLRYLVGDSEAFYKQELQAMLRQLGLLG
ncbi:MAG: TetR/AcrR family transcriptional regulator [Anaerolineales bacterium]|nr:TetR/AcrR family transcriptional regulator [Anaerolineales bacterium]